MHAVNQHNQRHLEIQLSPLLCRVAASHDAHPRKQPQLCFPVNVEVSSCLQRGADAHCEFCRVAGDPADGPGVHAAVKVLVLTKDLQCTSARTTTHRWCWVQRLLADAYVQHVPSAQLIRGQSMQ